MFKQEVLENWIRLKQDITEVKERDEGLVLIGDLNRVIGDGNLGVKGNIPSVSFGGGVLRELLAEKEHFLVNGLELAEGGPWTWVSRADKRIKSCRRVIMDENIPRKFFDTKLHHMWKGKFPKEDLSNHRFIHMNNLLPKVCESVVVSQM